jgi:hypothetical protein
MDAHKLLLHPADPEAPEPDPAAVLKALRQGGLVGEEFSLGGRRHYYAGERFLEQIVFLGCAPHVALEPPPDAGEPGTEGWGWSFCHVTLVRSPDVDFVGGDNILAPRCPRCRQTIDDWHAVVGVWRSNRTGHRCRCPGCGGESRAHELDWRQSAGFGRSFIEVWGIHNAEAVPAESLLSALQDATGAEWRYFYYHDR